MTSSACWDGIPDATTLAGFRHLVERGRFDKAIFGAVLARLETAGMAMHGGSVVDVTIVSAPSSTKNRSGERDPETRYRGIAKNAARICVLLAKANLLMVAGAGRRAYFHARPSRG